MTPKRKRRFYCEEDVVNALYDIFEHNLSQKKASEKHGVPQPTLSRRIKGGTAWKDRHQADRLISRYQEDRLVVWILRQESLGYSPSHGQIRACVQELLKPTGYTESIGKNWISRLVQRRPEIRNKIGRRQEASRFNAFTPKAVNWYFDIREKEYGWIKPENTVNMDEGGLMQGYGQYLSKALKL
jgi:hypothetical protein